MEDYLSVEEVEVFMGETWREDFRELVEDWLIPYGSAGLRQIFRNHDLDLDAQLEDNKLELIVLKSVLAEMISASLEAKEDSLPSGDATQFSQSAGGYSISMSGLSGSNLYLKKAQAKLLGLPGMLIKSITIN